MNPLEVVEGLGIVRLEGQGLPKCFGRCLKILFHTRFETFGKGLGEKGVNFHIGRRGGVDLTSIIAANRMSVTFVFGRGQIQQESFAADVNLAVGPGPIDSMAALIAAAVASSTLSGRAPAIINPSSETTAHASTSLELPESSDNTLLRPSILGRCHQSPDLNVTRRRHKSQFRH